MGHDHPIYHFEFNEPNEFELSRYYDAPTKDYEEINKISEYMINEKSRDQVNDIIVYWEGGVPPAKRESEEPRRRIFGISYRFDDGIYYIGRIKKRNSDEIKFLYAFTTEIPTYPNTQLNEVSKRMENIAEEVELIYSHDTSALIPVVLFLENRIRFEDYIRFESKVNEFKNRINIPLYNSRRSLRVDRYTHQFIDR